MPLSKRRRGMDPEGVDEQPRIPSLSSTNRTTTIAQLPLEIVFDVLERCDLEGRRSFAATCQWAHQVSLPILFREMHIRRGSVDLLAKYPFLQEQLTSIILITQLAERSNKVQSLVNRLSDMSSNMHRLREVTISNIDTISDFKMLSGFLAALRKLHITSLSIDFGHAFSGSSGAWASNLTAETRATVEDYDLNFLGNLKKLTLRFEAFVSHLITPVDIIPLAFGPSKDTLEFLHVELNEITYSSVRRRRRVKTNIPRWERIYHKNLISTSLKELEFSCVTSQDVTDLDRAFLPFADIGKMWPSLKRIMYMVNGSWNNETVFKALNNLSDLTSLEDLSLFSPRAFGWWSNVNRIFVDVETQLLNYGTNLPRSLIVVRFYARVFPQPPGSKSTVYEPVEAHITRESTTLGIKKICRGQKISETFFQRDWTYNLGNRR
ncbi:hypothetical protein TWF281_007799 [Arthrobotrys megalospora]